MGNIRIGWRTGWPWLAVFSLFLVSFSFDFGLTSYRKAFHCPPKEQGALLMRRNVESKLLEAYTALSRMGSPDNQRKFFEKRFGEIFHRVFVGEKFLFSEQAGLKKERDGIVVAMPLMGNSDATSAVIDYLGNLFATRSFPRPIRWVITSDRASLSSLEILKGLDKVRVMLVLDGLGNFQGGLNSQEYSQWTGRLYPSHGNFVAFVGGHKRDRDAVDVSSSLFKRFSDLPTQCFKQLPFQWNALSAKDLDVPTGVVPQVVISDTGKWRKPTDQLNLSLLAAVATGIEKVVESYALDENPSTEVPKFPTRVANH